MSVVRIEPLRALLVGSGVVALLGLALVLWAARDTNAPRLVVEPKPEGIPRIEVPEPWSFAAGGASASTGATMDTDGVELVADAASDAAAPARTALGALRTWSDAIRPVHIVTGDAIEAFRVVHIDSRGRRREFAPNDALVDGVFGKWDLVVVEAEGYFPRMLRAPDLRAASDARRRVELTPPSTVRLEYADDFRVTTRLREWRVESPIVLQADDMGDAGEFDRFCANFVRLLDPKSSDEERAALLRPLRWTPWFERVTELTNGPVKPFLRSPAALPFGRVVVPSPGVLPLAVTNLATPGGAVVTVFASSPVLLVNRLREGYDYPHRHTSGAPLELEPGGENTLRLSTVPYGSFSALLPTGASEIEVSGRWWEELDGGESSVGLLVEHDDASGEVWCDGAQSGECRLNAAWREPNGDATFAERRFDVRAGEHQDLGLLSASPSTALAVRVRVVDAQGRALADGANRLVGARAELGLRAASLVGPPERVLDFEAGPGDFTIRGLPREVVSLRLRRIELGPALAEAWTVEVPSYEVEADLRDDRATIELSVVVRPRSGLEVAVPLEGTLFAPGIRFTGIAVDRATGESKRLRMRWVDAESASRADCVLTGGLWDLTVAARCPDDHPNHPGEVWYGTASVALEDHGDGEVTVVLEPGATVVLPALAGSDEDAPVPGYLAVDPVESWLVDLGTTAPIPSRRVDGSYVASGLVPHSDYTVRTWIFRTSNQGTGSREIEHGTVEFTTGAPGSTVAVER